MIRELESRISRETDVLCAVSELLVPLLLPTAIRMSAWGARAKRRTPQDMAALVAAAELCERCDRRGIDDAAALSSHTRGSCMLRHHISELLRIVRNLPKLTECLGAPAAWRRHVPRQLESDVYRAFRHARGIAKELEYDDISGTRHRSLIDNIEDACFAIAGKIVDAKNRGEHIMYVPSDDTGVVVTRQDSRFERWVVHVGGAEPWHVSIDAIIREAEEIIGRPLRLSPPVTRRVDGTVCSMTLVPDSGRRGIGAVRYEAPVVWTRERPSPQ